MIGLLLVAALLALPQQKPDDPEVHPPVSQTDVKILEHAEQLLDTPAKWNRNDNRRCPAGAPRLSLYCAIEQATNDVSGRFEHREAAMQEVRFVIDSIAAKRNYEHRLMNYNNDPTTTFADIHRVLRVAKANVSRKLAEQQSAVPPQ